MEEVDRFYECFSCAKLENCEIENADDENGSCKEYEKGSVWTEVPKIDMVAKLREMTRKRNIIG